MSRGDTVLAQQNIMRDVISGLTDADLVVADVTGLNANVLYELGIAHGLRKPTVMVTQSIEELPFDLRSYRVVQYSIRFDQALKLRVALCNIAKQASEGSVSFGNPVTDFSSPREPPSLPPLAKSPAIDTRSPARTDDEAKGLWDFVAQSENALAIIVTSMTELRQLTVENGNRVVRHTSDIEDAKARGGLGLATRVHALINAAALDMSTYSDEGESRLPAFEVAISDLDAGIGGMVEYSNEESPEDRAKLREVRDVMSSFQETVRQAVAGVTAYRNSVQGTQGISREMNRAVRRLAGVLERLLAILQRLDSFVGRTVERIDARLE